MWRGAPRPQWQGEQGIQARVGPPGPGVDRAETHPKCAARSGPRLRGLAFPPTSCPPEPRAQRGSATCPQVPSRPGTPASSVHSVHSLLPLPHARLASPCPCCRVGTAPGCSQQSPAEESWGRVGRSPARAANRGRCCCRNGARAASRAACPTPKCLVALAFILFKAMGQKLGN